MGDEKAKIEVKYDWYQTDANVVIIILAKNVIKEKAQISYGPQSVDIKLVFPDGSEHTKQISLAEPINPHQCSHVVMTTKVEVKLLKVVAGRWDKLEAAQVKPEATTSCGPPSYPTSKPGKNWNAIERELKEQEAQEKPVGDEALNKLFQDIYGKGDENVKRAMNKSFMESCGTVLSTNWGEISKEKVEVKPPNDMEFKKWDS